MMEFQMTFIIPMDSDDIGIELRFKFEGSMAQRMLIL